MKIKADIKKLLNMPRDKYEIFHCETKNKKMLKQSDKPNSWPKEWKTIYYKGYPRLKELLLNKPKLSSSIGLKDVLINRNSVRKFSKKAVSFKKLSTLLYFSCGLKNYYFPWQNNRFYPSAGGRYPIEIYLLSLNTARLPVGVYHYYPKTHCLEVLNQNVTIDVEKWFGQEWIKTAGLILFISAVFKRTTMKYSNRGYKYTLLEAGHLGQNIHLISTSLNLGSCAIGGFIEKDIEKILDLDGVNESVVYSFVVGEL